MIEHEFNYVGVKCNKINVMLNFRNQMILHFLFSKILHLGIIYYLKYSKLGLQ